MLHASQNASPCHATRKPNPCIIIDKASLSTPSDPNETETIDHTAGKQNSWYHKIRNAETQNPLRTYQIWKRDLEKVPVRIWAPSLLLEVRRLPRKHTHVIKEALDKFRVARWLTRLEALAVLDERTGSELDLELVCLLLLLGILRESSQSR